MSAESQAIIAEVTGLSHEGRGIAHVNGKTTFILDALPGEQAEIRYQRRKSRYDEASALSIAGNSDLRTQPLCEHFGVCGGCSLQHLKAEAQIALKEKNLNEQLQHFGKLDMQTNLPPITGPIAGYRHKARLGVKYVEKKGRLLIGFRERNGRYLADITTCQVLHPSIGLALPELVETLSRLSIKKAIPQIEVAVAEVGTALVIRHLEALTDADKDILINFASDKDFLIYLQSGGIDTVAPLYPEPMPTLTYPIELAEKEKQLNLSFQPLDFTQINRVINQKMITQALSLLAPNKDDNILDLFCGLGNFSLPLATLANQVIGYEGEAGLVARAQQNAEQNNVNNVEFRQADLFKAPLNLSDDTRACNKILIDPPRSGAQLIVENISAFNADSILYVSCDPATLARDAGILQAQGYDLLNAGVIDMFPHTKHVESMAYFKKGK